MDANRDVTEVLQFFTRAAVLVRAFKAVEPHPNLTLWRVISGHALDIAITEWCKLFGSPREVVVGWRNVVSDSKAFHTGLLAALGQTEAEFEAYRDEVRTYRDKAVAHLDKNWREDVPTYPRLDIALEAVFYYWDHIHPEQAGGLKAGAALVQEQWAEILSAAMGATRHMLDY